MPKLIKTAIDRAEPAQTEYFIWDDSLKGFGLRVSPNGRKSYVFSTVSAAGAVPP